MKKFFNILFKIIFIVIVIGIIVLTYYLYKKFYFNDYIKAELVGDSTSFYRDFDVKYSDQNSYCIESPDFNDAMFFKDIAVEENTPYKLTCMVKTENVETEENTTAGACISVLNSIEQSKSITGTSDWQKIELMFNSKDRKNIQIGFRLGGYDGNAKGKAWFSNIKLEKGSLDSDNNWHMACFIIDNVNVNLEGKNYNFSMTNEDKTAVKENLKRFEDTCKNFSDNLMTATTDLYEINGSLTTLSYDSENGYYVAPNNVESLIAPYLENKEYDHIFVALRMGDTSDEIYVNDWIGLGGMQYYGIGFSNIRMPNDSKHSFMYKYDSTYNTFPEEVFIHEFLHSLERNLNDYGYEFPALHDYSKYGYTDENASGLEEWYKLYMSNRIRQTDGTHTGLDPIVYTTKPVQNSNFNNAKEIEFDSEPNNIFEGIYQILKGLVSEKKNYNTDLTNSTNITVSN